MTPSLIPSNFNMKEGPVKNIQQYQTYHFFYFPVTPPSVRFCFYEASEKAEKNEEPHCSCYSIQLLQHTAAAAATAASHTQPFQFSKLLEKLYAIHIQICMLYTYRDVFMCHTSRRAINPAK